MTARKLISAATSLAVASLMPALPTVAVAQTPIFDPSTSCRMQPALPADFSYVAEGIVTGPVTTQVLNTVITGGSGTLTYQNFYGQPYRVGQSTNLHSMASAAYPDSVATETRQDTQTITFNCNAYNSQGNFVQGLSQGGLTETVTGDPYQVPGVILPGVPYIESNVQVVVCISPSSTSKKGNPGEWRVQNGWTGSTADCATYSAMYPDYNSNSVPQ